MRYKSVFIGENQLKLNQEKVTGEYVDLNGELFYRISNYDLMDPFFMSIVSSSDFWMFISSKGGLTAGRKNPDNALFPYYTDDIIHDSNEKTGSKSIFYVEIENKTYHWEPFSNHYENIYKIKRNIYKNIPGNKILFEEINHDLGMTFSYSWLTSEKYGIIKKSKIVNNSGITVKAEFLDGIQNILPYGIDQQFQNAFSTLADGYKKNELIQELGIGIFSLSSIPSDKAEPSESLKATTVWSNGVEVNNYLLSSQQLNHFRNGESINTETDIKGRRGAFLINGEILLESGKSKDWFFAAEINQDISDLFELKHFLENEKEIKEKILQDIEAGTNELIKIVGSSDGIQISSDRLGTSRHFANVLFNVMRGGIFDEPYTAERNDFISFLNSANKSVLDRHKIFLDGLEKAVDHSTLMRKVKELKDNEFTKLAYEYLPLSFSRRHGDPSRPWNRFSIDIKDKENKKLLNYQGNWRDIFQNWEALAESFPGYIESMIAKFLNGSTADGYNPYRVTRDGFDWEIPEPDQPWANIGYWGDHQIIYLLKLLEFSFNHDSTKLSDLLIEEVFAYINVPYIIKDYQELLNDPHNTIEFDYDLNKEIEAREKEIGSDARYLLQKDNSIYQVNLAEKLLVTLLSKLSNFIPGGGIWMNTQRPEWNDANNALVGYGVSMVTLYYLRRYVNFLLELFAKAGFETIILTSAVKNLLLDIHKVLISNLNLLAPELSDKNRKSILDGIGKAGSIYRNLIYDKNFVSDKTELGIGDLQEFLNVSQKYIEYTIEVNRREDGLYHSYNLMSVKNDEVQITNLYEMLEGQVAVLSSGYLKPAESIKLLESLRNSALYREDQNSYILYPDRVLPRFFEKNIIPFEDFNTSKIFKTLLKIDNKDIVTEDVNGNFHFNGEIRNAGILKSKLEEIKKKNLAEVSDKEIEAAINIYESVFNHKYFTGRSGTFYKYEGLGSIYWHMVSKLLLAVEETYFDALDNGTSYEELSKIKSFYYEIKEGIGVHKSPENYGAFPTDPYSHTPGFAGVQQPGMTGQVKEDVISRFRELGVRVVDGEIVFSNKLLNRDEFLEEESIFQYYSVNKKKKEIKLPGNSLAFTYCQVPVVYFLSDENNIILHFGDNNKLTVEELKINKELSNSVFSRDKKISKIEVYFNNIN